MPEGAISRVEPASVSHNLLGQRLGRKGRDTRERILAATERLLADPQGGPLSLSAVAREASLGMTTLYLYFGDLIELLLAVLAPIMASAEQTYIGELRRHWRDDELAARCLSFVCGFHAFWKQHSHVLHLRNSYAAGNDPRMVRHRIESSRPLIDLIVRQMDAGEGEARVPAVGMATALLTGIERLVTVATDANLSIALSEDAMPDIPNLLRGQARLLELGIRDGRASAAG